MCNFCNGSVQFILKRDPNGYFKFASLQSEAGKKLLTKYDIPENSNSFILIQGEKWHSKSNAALLVCKELTGFWRLLYVCKVIPRQIRDVIYDTIAKNRYKWFGKRESCMLPTTETKKRFLD